MSRWYTDHIFIYLLHMYQPQIHFEITVDLPLFHPQIVCISYLVDTVEKFRINWLTHKVIRFYRDAHAVCVLLSVAPGVKSTKVNREVLTSKNQEFIICLTFVL